MNWIHNALNLVIPVIQEWLGSVGAIAVVSVIHFLIFIACMSFFKKEWQKRQLIVEEIDAFKKNYVLKETDHLTAAENGEEKMQHLLNRKYKDYPDDFFEEMADIAEKRRPKPLLALLAMSMQLFVFLSFLTYFFTQENLGNQLHFLIAAALLMVVLLWGRKLWGLKVFMLALSIYIYLNFNAESLLFVTFVLGLRVIYKFSMSRKKEQ